jgi:catechol 2,3-dioxygenase-like lactoylglutathione lyase family enzyme
MIDHMGFRVRDLAASRRFYDACAEALGLAVIANTEASFLIGRSARGAAAVGLGWNRVPGVLDDGAHDVGEPDPSRFPRAGSPGGR